MLKTTVPYTNRHVFLRLDQVHLRLSTPRNKTEQIRLHLYTESRFNKLLGRYMRHLCTKKGDWGSLGWRVTEDQTQTTLKVRLRTAIVARFCRREARFTSDLWISLVVETIFKVYTYRNRSEDNSKYRRRNKSTWIRKKKHGERNVARRAKSTGLTTNSWSSTVPLDWVGGPTTCP